ncbi:MAG: arsenate reductase (glutaredoxin) [Bacteroidetes bacterium]|jgi:arsenate reductase|nr:arsenate reductase (glutaredoxin) [Bacteroidota bacterium]
MTTLYHNPRCSKSREALEILNEKGEEVNVIHYLKTPPTTDELRNLISLLKIKPIELIRTQEAEWKENFKDKNLSDDELIEAMIAFPKLIERPIVVKNSKAIIGRPPQKIIDIL